VWIFGYGSLVWRPAFPFAERQPARIKGYMRRFWQASPDHRGTPEQPGRVVTLLPQPNGEVAGMAYRVLPDRVDQVLSELDYREKAGYERVDARLHLADRAPIGLVYIATRDNPNFVGPAPNEQIASRIRQCTGPSGPNLEYLMRLHEALRAQGTPDEHVEALVRAL
jgi:glutathione-specific gamma-glutamylcyclotransferase